MSHDHEDKPRRSWREIDQRRDGSRTRSDEPRGFAAREEQARAKETTLSTADALFSMNKGGAEGARLAAEMHAAHGSEGFGLAVVPTSTWLAFRTILGCLDSYSTPRTRS